VPAQPAAQPAAAPRAAEGPLAAPAETNVPQKPSHPDTVQPHGSGHGRRPGLSPPVSRGTGRAVWAPGSIGPARVAASQGAPVWPHAAPRQTHPLPAERDLHVRVDKDFLLPYDLGETTHDARAHAGQALGTIQPDTEPGPGSLRGDSFRQQQVSERQIHVPPLSWSPGDTALRSALTGRGFGSCPTTGLFPQVFPHQKRGKWGKNVSVQRDTTLFPRATQDRTASTFQCPHPGCWRRWEGSPQRPRVR